MNQVNFHTLDLKNIGSVIEVCTLEHFLAAIPLSTRKLIQFYFLSDPERFFFFFFFEKSQCFFFSYIHQCLLTLVEAFVSVA